MLDATRCAGTIWSSVLGWAVAALMIAARTAVADLGEGYLLMSVSDDTQFLDVAFVDPDTSAPLDGMFTSNAQGDYAYEAAVLVLPEGGDPVPLGVIELAGQGDPYLELTWELSTNNLAALGAQGTPIFASILGGIHISEISDPGDMSNHLRTTQHIDVSGDAGSTPPSVSAAASVFMLTADDKSTNALAAGVSGGVAVPGHTVRDSGLATIPEVPSESTETGFTVLEIQHDIALFALATDSELTWNVNVRTDIVQLSGIPGDYNNDGVVTAADYVVWRDKLGSPAGTLPNDPAGGPIGTVQYQQWIDNFGRDDSLSGVVATVPEPAGTVICCLFVGGLLRVRKARVG